MKKLIKIFMLLVLWLSSITCPAQTQGLDKLEALRVSFINKKIELTISEAEKFWPIYNTYNEKLRSIKINQKQAYKKMPVNPDEKSAETFYQILLQSRQAEADLYSEYSSKIKNIIGVRKLVKLYEAEEAFKREIINSIKGQE
jgi:hypothetical protein